MGVGSNVKETVNLVPGNMTMTQTLNMHMFEITQWTLGYRDNRDGLRVTIVLKRKFVSELMTTYFPSFLLLAITLATTFFKPFFFEAALSVNLTTMLVMMTNFISKMEGLPPTSDTKMIDLWLVFCQVIPIAEVVLLTAMEYQRTAENEDLSSSKCIQVAPLVDKEKMETKTKKWYQRANLRMLIPSLKTMGKTGFF